MPLALLPSRRVHGLHILEGQQQLVLILWLEQVGAGVLAHELNQLVACCAKAGCNMERAGSCMRRTMLQWPGGITYGISMGGVGHVL